MYLYFHRDDKKVHHSPDSLPVFEVVCTMYIYKYHVLIFCKIERMFI